LVEGPIGGGGFGELPGLSILIWWRLGKKDEVEYHSHLTNSDMVAAATEA